MNEDFHEGEIVFLRFMRFPDDNKIDYRINGRPYLVYKVEEENVYLFKIGRSRVDEYSYYPIKLKNKKKSVDCFVDLRYIIVIDKKELIEKKLALHGENKAYRNSNKVKSLDKKDFEKVKEKVSVITTIRELEAVITNYDLIFND